MPRIPAHTLDTAPPATHDTLKALQRRHGKILNVHAGMAHAPIVLATYTALREAIAEHATYDAATQEAIALTVAAADRCDYCQAAHTGAARKAGLSFQEDNRDPRGAAGRGEAGRLAGRGPPGRYPHRRG